MPLRDLLKRLLIGLMLGTQLTATAEVRRVEFESRLLGRMLTYSVLLPEGTGHAVQRLPVVYLLHGAGGDASSWLELGAEDIVAALAREGRMRASVLVLPSLGPESWWIDGAADAAARSFFAELMPHVEARWPVRADRAGRSIAGVSMGGFGALALVLRRPEQFCAAALISPAAYEAQPPAESAARRSPQFMREGAFAPDLWASAGHLAQLDAYARAPAKVPMWIGVGDHDALGLALESAKLFWRLRAIPSQELALRIVGGAHDAETFRAALPEALTWVDHRCAAAR